MRLLKFLRRLCTKVRSQIVDLLLILILLTISFYITLPLLDFQNNLLDRDVSGMISWVDFLRTSLFEFKEFPLWIPIQAGGMPFPSIVPPLFTYLILFFTFFTGGSIPTAVNLGFVCIFALASLAMYKYLKTITKNPIASFAGALLYGIFPVHTDMILWGLFAVNFAYFLMPLIFYLFEKLTHNKNYLPAVVLSLTLMVLDQLEISFIFIIFLFIPYVIFRFFFTSKNNEKICNLFNIRKYPFYSTFVSILIFILFFLPYFLTVIVNAHDMGHSDYQINMGRMFWSFNSPTDFLNQQELPQDIGSPFMGYYVGWTLIISLLIFPTVSLILRKKTKIEFIQRMVPFFLVISFVHLLLCFEQANLFYESLPFMNKIRVMLRFHYLFVFDACISLSLSFALLYRRLRVPSKFGYSKTKYVLITSIILIFLATQVVDYSSYFSTYKYNRVPLSHYTTREELVGVLRQNFGTWGENRTDIRYLPHSRFYITDYLTYFSTDLTIQSFNSWLPWAQHRDFRPYENLYLLLDANHFDKLHFYASIHKIDFILIFSENKSFVYHPQVDEVNTYGVLLSQNLQNTSQFNKLTELNKPSLSITVFSVEAEDNAIFKRLKLRFYKKSNSFLFYSEKKDIFTDFYTMYNVVTAINNITLSHNEFLNHAAFVNDPSLAHFILGDFHFFNSVTPLLADISAMNKKFFIIEAEKADSEGWEEVHRTNIPISYNSNMAIKDATAHPNNSLHKKVKIVEDGYYYIDIYYYANINTGKLKVFIDGQMLGEIDTYGIYNKSSVFKVYLTKGEHLIKLVGTQSEREEAIYTDTKGGWVEVDRIAIIKDDALEDLQRNFEDFAKTFSNRSHLNEANPLNIEDFKLTPSGITIEAATEEDGIISVAYLAIPGWKLYINGQEENIVKVNGLYLGAEITQGHHIIEFKYEPVTLYYTNLLTLIAVIAIIAYFILQAPKIYKVLRRPHRN